MTYFFILYSYQCILYKTTFNPTTVMNLTNLGSFFTSTIKEISHCALTASSALKIKGKQFGKQQAYATHAHNTIRKQNLFCIFLKLSYFSREVRLQLGLMDIIDKAMAADISGSVVMEHILCSPNKKAPLLNTLGDNVSRPSD